jgi:hypothetical protein
MPLSVKPWLIAAGVIILLFVSIGIVRNYLWKSPTQWDDTVGRFMKPVVFSMFILLGAVMVPVFLKVYMVMQTKAGNEQLSQVMWIKNNLWQIIYGVWLVFAVGLGISLPYMIKHNFFTE